MVENKCSEEWAGRDGQEGFMFEVEFEHKLEEENGLWLRI